MSLYNLLLLKEKKRTASANVMHLTYFTFAGLGAGALAWDAWIRSWKKDRNLITKYTGVYVVVQFYPWFKFYFLLFWGMVMYDNEFKTKENKI